MNNKRHGELRYDILLNHYINYKHSYLYADGENDKSVIDQLYRKLNDLIGCKDLRLAIDIEIWDFGTDRVNLKTYNCQDEFVSRGGI